MYSNKKARHESRHKPKWRPSASSSMMPQVLQVGAPQTYEYMCIRTIHRLLGGIQMYFSPRSMSETSR